MKSSSVREIDLVCDFLVSAGLSNTAKILVASKGRQQGGLIRTLATRRQSLRDLFRVSRICDLELQVAQQRRRIVALERTAQCARSAAALQDQLAAQCLRIRTLERRIENPTQHVSAENLPRKRAEPQRVIYDDDSPAVPDAPKILAERGRKRLRLSELGPVVDLKYEDCTLVSDLAEITVGDEVFFRTFELCGWEPQLSDARRGRIEDLDIGSGTLDVRVVGDGTSLLQFSWGELGEVRMRKRKTPNPNDDGKVEKLPPAIQELLQACTERRQALEIGTHCETLHTQ